MRLGPQGLNSAPSNSDFSSDETGREDSKNKHVGFLIGLGFFILFAFLFIWRTTYFYIQYVRGDLEPPTSFISNLTRDSSIQVPIAAGDVDSALLDNGEDPSIGPSSDDALLTIVVFSDFGCPFCKDSDYITRASFDNSDIVRFVYRDFPVVELHPNAQLAAEAGECAHEQNRFFDYHDKLFANQFDLSVVALKRYAAELGLDTVQFDSCFDSHRYKDEVLADRLDGINAGVRGTPTFFFNGTRIEGSIPEDVFEVLLEKFGKIDEIRKSL